MPGNTVHVAADYPLVNALAGTMKTVFPNVYIVDVFADVAEDSQVLLVHLDSVRGIA
jgi:hypothetical protein